MKFHEETRIMAFSVDQMFDLVADIEAYPEFIPWCHNIRVISSEPGTDATRIKSEMVVAFKSLRESFVSEAVFANDKSSIEVCYRERVFRFFHSKWEFHARDDGSTLVKFETRYEFKTKILELLAGTFFWHAAKKIVSAFERRAHKIYGLNN